MFSLYQTARFICTSPPGQEWPGRDGFAAAGHDDRGYGDGSSKVVVKPGTGRVIQRRARARPYD